jgi:hypothetical protein
VFFQPKRTIDDVDMKWGICLWQLPDGTYIQNSDGDYLSAGPAKIGNPTAEKNIKAAARSCGITQGKPFWLPGFRKISDYEWADQMERLMEGKIADPADLYRQATGDNG